MDIFTIGNEEDEIFEDETKRPLTHEFPRLIALYEGDSYFFPRVTLEALNQKATCPRIST